MSGAARWIPARTGRGSAGRRCGAGAWGGGRRRRGRGPRRRLARGGAAAGHVGALIFGVELLALLLEEREDLGLVQRLERQDLAPDEGGVGVGHVVETGH